MPYFCAIRKYLESLLCLSGSDCVHLGLVKICADEVHSVSPPLRPVNVKPYLIADNSRLRDMPSQLEPTSSTRLSNVTHPSTTLTMKWVLAEFQNVHTGLGQLGRPVTFNMDPTVKPVHDAIHRQPVQPVVRHTKIKEQFNKMENEGKIYRQYAPTAWCSNMTVRETKGKVRICLDPSNIINKAIQVPKHPIPSFEDIFLQLKGAKGFSVADAMSGFTNSPLDLESSLPTTFRNPICSLSVAVSSVWCLKWP